MRHFTSNANGRYVVIHLGKGDGILEGISQACQELGIRDAMVVSGIGSARKMVYHYVASTADDPENVFVTIDEACEVGTMHGMVLDGDVHVHVSFSDRNHAYNGHLEPGCEVLYLLEIALIEMPDMELRRCQDEFGISYIDRR